MNVIRRLLLFANLLSLDVVLGAMGGMLFFSDLLATKLPGIAYIILGLAVWSIYTMDHLLDGKSTEEGPHSHRHRFHRQYFKPLVALVACAILSGGFLFLTSDSLAFVLIPGLALGFVIVIWMGLLKIAGSNYAWLKEFSTALIYVAGISLTPFFSLDLEYVSSLFYPFAGIYFVTAWVNLLVLSYLDMKIDQRDGFGSILVLISKTQLGKLIVWLAAIGLSSLLVLVFFIPSYYYIHTLILGMMLSYHLLLFLSENPNRRIIRQKLEAVFLLPILLVFF